MGARAASTFPSQVPRGAVGTRLPGARAHPVPRPARPKRRPNPGLLPLRAPAAGRSLPVLAGRSSRRPGAHRTQRAAPGVAPTAPHSALSPGASLRGRRAGWAAAYQRQVAAQPQYHLAATPAAFPVRRRGGAREDPCCPLAPRAPGRARR